MNNIFFSKGQDLVWKENLKKFLRCDQLVYRITFFSITHVWRARCYIVRNILMTLSDQECSLYHVINASVSCIFTKLGICIFTLIVQECYMNIFAQKIGTMCPIK